MAAVLVLNTPDDGRLRPKLLEWPCRNKTFTVLHQVGVSFDFILRIKERETRLTPQEHDDDDNDDKEKQTIQCTYNINEKDEGT